MNSNFMRESFPIKLNMVKQGIFPELQDYGGFTRWWHKDTEIDVVGVKEDTLLVGECKWRDSVDGARILNELKDKARGIGWKGKIEYAIFTRAFASEPSEAHTYSLVDIEELLRN